MKRFFTLFILYLGVVTSIFSQGINLNQGSIKQEKYLQKIQYQNINGKIVVPVTINGKMYKFIIDTGAPLTISEKLFKDINPQIIGNAAIADASGRKKEATIIMLPELHLQEITFINTPGFVLREESSDFINILECLGIDGIIGSNMLRNSIIQFDAQSEHVLITNNYNQIPKKKVVIGQKMELTPSQSSPIITVIFQKKGLKRIGDRALFDSGASDFYSMSIRAFNWLESRLEVVKIAESEGSFEWGFHGTFEKQYHLLLSIPALHVNKTIFDNVIVSTTHSTSRIGAQIFQYGKTTLDFKKKRFYFELFDNINTDNLFERPWAIMPTWQNDKLEVGIIWDKTFESEINLGDEVLSINGFDIQAMDACEYLKSDEIRSSNEDRILVIKNIKTGEIKKIEIKRLQLIE